jgi:hypothetical protein
VLQYLSMMVFVYAMLSIMLLSFIRNIYSSPNTSSNTPPSSPPIRPSPSTGMPAERGERKRTRVGRREKKGRKERERKGERDDKVEEMMERE